MFHFTDSKSELHFLFNFESIFVLSEHMKEHKICFLAGKIFAWYLKLVINKFKQAME